MTTRQTRRELRRLADGIRPLVYLKLLQVQGFRLTCGAAVGAIPTVQILGHVQFVWPVFTNIAATFDALRNMAIGPHGDGVST